MYLNAVHMEDVNKIKYSKYDIDLQRHLRTSYTHKTQHYVNVPNVTKNTSYEMKCKLHVC